MIWQNTTNTSIGAYQACSYGSTASGNQGSFHALLRRIPSRRRTQVHQ
jgi:hypothetical protein